MRTLTLFALLLLSVPALAQEAPAPESSTGDKKEAFQFSEIVYNTAKQTITIRTDEGFLEGGKFSRKDSVDYEIDLRTGIMKSNGDPSKFNSYEGTLVQRQFELIEKYIVEAIAWKKRENARQDATAKNMKSLALK